MSVGLNLGCGDDVRERWVNVDVSEEVDPDVVHDLDETPWPFDDDTFDVVEARHVLEHLGDPMEAVREMCRVAKPGADIIVVYPIGHTSFEDPTHRHHWNVKTAEWLEAPQKHGHENELGLLLMDREVEWHVHPAFPLVPTAVGLMERFAGPGPWMSQVPGLFGEVEARYEA